MQIANVIFAPVRYWSFAAKVKFREKYHFFLGSDLFSPKILKGSSLYILRLTKILVRKKSEILPYFRKKWYFFKKLCKTLHPSVIGVSQQKWNFIKKTIFCPYCLHIRRYFAFFKKKFSRICGKFGFVAEMIYLLLKL